MRKVPLSKESIIATAIEIADREDFSAVSLRRIASQLGVHVTSLYNHVPTKEAVLDGIVEYLMDSAELPAKVSGWQDWIRQFAAALRKIARKHPGAIAAFHHRPVQGPKAAEYPEAGLEAFRAAGCDVSEAYNAVKATGLVVFGLLLEEVAKLQPGAPRKTDVRGLPRERFPRTHALPAIKKKSDLWSYTIETLIAGIAANLRCKNTVR